MHAKLRISTLTRSSAAARLTHFPSSSKAPNRRHRQFTPSRLSCLDARQLAQWAAQQSQNMLLAPVSTSNKTWQHPHAHVAWSGIRPAWLRPRGPAFHAATSDQQAMTTSAPPPARAKVQLDAGLHAGLSQVSPPFLTDPQPAGWPDRLPNACWYSCQSTSRCPLPTLTAPAAPTLPPTTGGTAPGGGV